MDIHAVEIGAEILAPGAILAAGDPDGVKKGVPLEIADPMPAEIGAPDVPQGVPRAIGAHQPQQTG